MTSAVETLLGKPCDTWTPWERWGVRLCAGAAGALSVLGIYLLAGIVHPYGLNGLVTGVVVVWAGLFGLALVAVAWRRT